MPTTDFLTKLFAMAVIALSFQTQGGAVTAKSIVANFDGISGESTVDKHAEWIDVLSISWSAMNSEARQNIGSKASSSSTNRRSAVASEMQLRVVYDKASPILQRSVFAGEIIATVTVEQLEMDGGQLFSYLSYDLTHVVVTSFAINAGDSLGRDEMIISLAFRDIAVEYNYNQASGTKAGYSAFGWDTSENKPF